MYQVELISGVRPSTLNGSINRALKKLNNKIKLLIDIKYDTLINKKGETEYLAHIIYEEQ